MNQVDRKRIKKEEIFRSELRKSLERPKTRFQAALMFLNTGVGLWLLGTVAATGVSLSYAYIQEHIRVSAERTTKEKKLTLETKIRQLQWQSQLIGRRALGDETTPEEFNVFFRKLLAPPQLDNAPSSGIYSMFPEYDRRSLLSIIYELNEVVESEKDKSEVIDAISFLVEWDPLVDRKTSLDAYFEMIRKANIGIEFRNMAVRHSETPSLPGDQQKY
jgi:hypothetical protein